MLSVTQLIDQLLHSHDCVVLPGLGGFITSYEEASSHEGVLTPPRRSVRFNQELTQDDGLLLHAYMVAYDADYIAAEKQMRLDIAMLRDEMTLKGSCMVEGIGRLRLDLSGKITLEPLPSGIATPALYALENFSVEPVADLLKQRELQQQLQQTTLLPIVPAEQPDAQTQAEKGDAVVVRIHRRWIDLACSAAAAAILFFLLSYPSLRRADNAQEEAIIAGANPTVTKKTSTTTASTPVRQATPQPTKDYTIVLACQVSKKNADLFINQLAGKGLCEAQYDTQGKFPRILYSAYASEDEAIEALRALRKQADEFAQAWVSKR